MAISKIIYKSSSSAQGETWMDLTQDTVSDANHIRNGYVGHLNDGTSATGSYSGTSPTLTTKSITANGTYNASSDNADGYSSVTVDVPHVGPQFELIGQSTHTLSAYTNTSEAEIIDTGIDIKNTNYAYILTVITCDGTKTNDNDWGGLTITIGSRYTSNSAYYGGANLWSKNGVSLLFSDMVRTNANIYAYGVVVTTNTDTIQFRRKAHATVCPELMAGTYTVKVYGITAL